MAVIAEWDSGPLPATGGADVPTVAGDQIVVAGPGQGYAIFDLGSPVGIYSFRYYLTLPAAWASAATNVVRAVGGAGIRATNAIAGSGAPGQIRFAGNGGSTGQRNSPQNTVAFSATHRIEMRVDGPNSEYLARVYDTDDSTVLYESTVGPGGAMDAVTKFEVGKLSSTNLGEIRFSHFRAEDSLKWIGPYDPDPPDPPVGGLKMEYWDGSNLIPVKAERWDGTNLVPVIAERT